MNSSRNTVLRGDSLQPTTLGGNGLGYGTAGSAAAGGTGPW
jgi:hypothetical protein